MVLIEKPSQGYRPLTILSIAWRIGARVLVKQLTSWVERWASWRVLGGVAHRGLKDSYLRLLESLSSPRFYLQEDLTKFFDSVRLPDLVGGGSPAPWLPDLCLAACAELLPGPPAGFL